MQMSSVTRYNGVGCRYEKNLFPLLRNLIELVFFGVQLKEGLASPRRTELA